VKRLVQLWRGTVGVLLFAVSHCALAQVDRVTDVHVRFFLQASGQFSQPYSESDVLWNVVAGGGSFPESTSSALVDVAIAGPSEGRRPALRIEFLVKHAETGKVLMRRRAIAPHVGPTGRTHVGFWLPAIGCEPLTLIASAKGSSKSIHLPFRCGE
jgi:hypothetical protein